MGKLARNELRKLKAAWYNSVSAAFVTVGMLGPVVARIFGALNAPINISLIVLVPIICLTASAILHFAGQAELKELEDCTCSISTSCQFP